VHLGPGMVKRRQDDKIIPARLVMVGLFYPGGEDHISVSQEYRFRRACGTRGKIKTAFILGVNLIFTGWLPEFFKTSS